MHIANYMKNNELNPFILGKYVSDEYFCDREKETELLKKQVFNGRNVTIISDRRIGKSGLISHLFAQKDIQEHFYTISVDLYPTNSLAEMVCTFSEEVYRVIQHHSGTWKDKFFQVISSLRVGLKLDAITGSPTFDIGIGDIEAPSMTLEQIFSFLELADKPCIVALDEFQQIGSYEEQNIEALLRTYVQRCKKTQFIFAGSRKHLMAQMFLSPSKPFYQSTMNMGLEPIDLTVYSDFVQRMFAKGNKQIDYTTIERIYTLCRGITWHMQVLLNEMYTLIPEGGHSQSETVDAALNNVLLLQEPFYREILATLAPRQKKLLFALISEGKTKNITSSAFIAKHKLGSASSVQSALKGLYEKDIVTKQDEAWLVYDIFLTQYVKTL